MAKTSFDALTEVLIALRDLDIPYLLVGSFSSNFYSYPRATKDADIEIKYAAGDLQRIRQRLDDEFSLDPQSAFETLTGSVRNVLSHEPTGFDIELFRLGDDPHHQIRFQRRRIVKIPELGFNAVIPTAEDVLIQKLRWQREKDIDDARKVIQIQYANLDWEHIRHWTGEHGTSTLLEKLRIEAES